MLFENLAYLPQLLKGAGLSLQVACLSLLASCLMGFLLALCRLSNSTLLRFLATTYISIIRGVPDLVMMFLIFFGSQLLVNQLTEAYDLDYIILNAFSAGVMTLSLIYSAFMAETFRAAIQAVDAHQLEAARSFGMKESLVHRRILIPQMMLHALPGLSNNWLVLVKSTAILSVIGLQDMIYAASIASRSTHQPFFFYFIASIVYLLVTWGSVKMISKIEQHYNLGHQN